ncbi:putative serine carboxypeptidase CPVL [Ixodes scapularis]
MLNILRYDHSLPKVKGLILSSPYVDPETQVDISELLYQTGFVSEKQASVMRAQFQTVIQLVHRDNFTEAKRVMDTVIDGSWGLPATLFENMTGLRQAFNLDLSTDPPELAAYESFLERHDVRAALHVGDVPFSDDYSLVQKHMYSDMMTSQARNFGELLDQGIKVLVFGGQKDLLVPFSSVERLMSRLDWKGQLEYKATERTPWMLDHSRVGGYFRQVRNYTEVLIRGAGHMVPFDKPKEVLTLVNKFIKNLPIQEAL